MSYYYMVADNGNYAPDVNIEYLIYRPYREPGNFVIETKVELGEYIEVISPSDPIITTHDAWWATHPNEKPQWVTPGGGE